MRSIKLTITKEQYIVMGLSAFLYLLMLTKIFSFLSIDSTSLIDLIIISTPYKVQQAINNLPLETFSPHYIQFFLDSLFVTMFYPLLISFFYPSPHFSLVCCLSGVGDVIENGMSCYFLYERAPDSLTLYIASIATNFKFLFLIVFLVILLVRFLRKPL